MHHQFHYEVFHIEKPIEIQHRSVRADGLEFLCVSDEMFRLDSVMNKKPCDHTDASITVLLLWRDTMTRATYKTKHLFGALLTVSEGSGLRLSGPHSK